jgi:hypothetical protein
MRNDECGMEDSSSFRIHHSAFIISLILLVVVLVVVGVVV